jgi:hypothetical protein
MVSRALATTLLLMRNSIRLCDQNPLRLPTIRNPLHCRCATKRFQRRKQLKMPRRDPLARARNRPRPEEWRDDELMTLAEAAAVFWPDGPLTVRSLRTEIAKGSLTAEQIAGKVFVTPAALKEMRQRCRARRTLRDSTSANARDAIQSGSSSTPEMRSAQAAALEIVRARRGHLRVISRGSTSRGSG